MLTGTLPFGPEEVLASYSSGEVTIPFPDQYWGSISVEAKQLTKQLLCKDAKVRISAIGALNSAWISGNNDWDVLSLLTSTNTNAEINSAREDVNNSSCNNSSVREGVLLNAAISRQAKARWRASICAIRVLLRTGGINLVAQSPDLAKFHSQSSLASINSPESEWDYSIADSADLSLSHTCSMDSLDYGIPSMRSINNASAPQSIGKKIEVMTSDEMSEEYSKVLERVRSRQQKRHMRTSNFARMSESPQSGGRLVRGSLGGPKNCGELEPMRSCASPSSVADVYGSHAIRSRSEVVPQHFQAKARTHSIQPDPTGEVDQEQNKELNGSGASHPGSPNGDGTLGLRSRTRPGKGTLHTLKSAFRWGKSRPS